MPEQELATLKLSFCMVQGRPGRNADPKNPISRARVAHEGQYSPPELCPGIPYHQTPGEPWRWFGVFVLESYGSKETREGFFLPSQKYRALNRSICLILSISPRSWSELATLRTSAFASTSVNRNTR